MKNPELWLSSGQETLRILYPDGKVEVFRNYDEDWYRSYFSSKTYKAAKQFLVDTMNTKIGEIK